MICTGTWVEETNRSILEEAALQPFLKRREYLDSRSGTEKTPDAYYYAFCIINLCIGQDIIYNEEFDPGSG